jgi:dihydroorotase
MESYKTEQDKEGLLKALTTKTLSPRTMHHILWRKKPYFQSMSGAPMVQHSLNCMLEFYKQELISLEK